MDTICEKLNEKTIEAEKREATRPEVLGENSISFYLIGVALGKNSGDVFKDQKKSEHYVGGENEDTGYSVSVDFLQACATLGGIIERSRGRVEGRVIDDYVSEFISSASSLMEVPGFRAIAKGQHNKKDFRLDSIINSALSNNSELGNGVDLAVMAMTQHISNISKAVIERWSTKRNESTLEKQNGVENVRQVSIGTP